jgi:1-acyl-sn-glycerol-3-phosphate acyltransferase
MRGATGATPRNSMTDLDADVVLREIGRLLDLLCLRSGRPLSLDTELATDLGVDSLALIELMDQLETSLGVTLTDDVLLTASTPRDWLNAIRAARGEVATVSTAAEATLHQPPGQAWPRDAATLLDAWTWHVDTHPSHIALRVITSPDPRGFEDVSYGALDRQSRMMASALVAQGLVRGERVAIMLPAGRENIAVVFSVLLAGAVPLPIGAPADTARVGDSLMAQSQILVNAGAAFLITQSETLSPRLVRSRVTTMRVTTTPTTLMKAPSEGLPLPSFNGSDTAIITDASGDIPRGRSAVLTHHQLVKVIVELGGAISIDSSDVVVTWLAPYEGFGLIGGHLAPILFGVPAVVVSPHDEVAGPAMWLRAISDHEGTICAGSNSAYANCAERVTDVELSGLDLSHWRVAFVGARPLNATTIDRFSERYARYGFHRDALRPDYDFSVTAPEDTGGALAPDDHSVRRARALPRTEGNVARRRARPTARTAVSRLYDAYAGVLLLPTVIVALVVCLVPVAPRIRRALARAVIRSVLRALAIPLRVDGAFPTPGEPFVVVANHSSFLDALALYVTVPDPAVYVTSTDLGSTAIIGPVLRRFGCLFVQRGRSTQGVAAVDEMAAVVRRGERLVVFPEGSLSRAVGLRPFHLGAFDTAVVTGRPVVPVGVRGARDVLPPGARWLRRGAIRVVVGEPLAVTGHDFAAKVALRDEARHAVALLCGLGEMGSS